MPVAWARFDDLGQGVLLLCGVTLHRLTEVRDQVSERRWYWLSTSDHAALID